MKWNVTLAAGTKVLVSLEDADGEEGWSGEVRSQSFLRFVRCLIQYFVVV
jgi:hypothetical protein